MAMLPISYKYTIDSLSLQNQDLLFPVWYRPFFPHRVSTMLPKTSLLNDAFISYLSLNLSFCNLENIENYLTKHICMILGTIMVDLNDFLM